MSSRRLEFGDIVANSQRAGLSQELIGSFVGFNSLQLDQLGRQSVVLGVVLGSLLLEDIFRSSLSAYYK